MTQNSSPRCYSFEKFESELKFAKLTKDEMLERQRKATERWLTPEMLQINKDLRMQAMRSRNRKRALCVTASLASLGLTILAIVVLFSNWRAHQITIHKPGAVVSSQDRLVPSDVPTVGTGVVKELARIELILPMVTPVVNASTNSESESQKALCPVKRPTRRGFPAAQQRWERASNNVDSGQIDNSQEIRFLLVIAVCVLGIRALFPRNQAESDDGDAEAASEDTTCVGEFEPSFSSCALPRTESIMEEKLLEAQQTITTLERISGEHAEHVRQLENKLKLLENGIQESSESDQLLRQENAALHREIKSLEAMIEKLQIENDLLTSRSKLDSLHVQQYVALHCSECEASAVKLEVLDRRRCVCRHCFTPPTPPDFGSVHGNDKENDKENEPSPFSQSPRGFTSPRVRSVNPGLFPVEGVTSHAIPDPSPRTSDTSDTAALLDISALPEQISKDSNCTPRACIQQPDSPITAPDTNSGCDAALERSSLKEDTVVKELEPRKDVQCDSQVSLDDPEAQLPPLISLASP